MSRQRTRIDHELHPGSRRFDGCIRHRFTQTEVVDDYVHIADAIACSASLARSPISWSQLAGIHGSPNCSRAVVTFEACAHHDGGSDRSLSLGRDEGAHEVEYFRS